MKLILTKITGISISTLLMVLLFAGIANAQGLVNVQPSQATISAEQTYSLTVANDKKAAVTKVTLTIPDTMTFEQFQPVSGWHVAMNQGTSNKVTSITFTAANQGISAGQFQEFTVLVKNPKKAQIVAWHTTEYFNDGSFIRYDGNVNSNHPQSLTNILAASPSQATSNGTSDPNSVPSSNLNTNPPTAGMKMMVVYVALIISVVALLVAVIRKPGGSND